ncbi:hypothetical protein [Bradyrhizobium cytisi]|uniref:Uncharacterized protein n=1 Tax=Bradyrhizobium cytisi TaxID=515489 RepID=A0A5S4X0P2_9BRAD|nr:hypothetical protein [Bradyrhizobium cytisi]TYL87462.1 hypothetical protein FXB38_04920 [Bradyrhizobium cytisi]
MTRDDAAFTCPDCGGFLFRPGPCGGVSQNIECVGCGSRFNVALARPAGVSRAHSERLQVAGRPLPEGAAMSLRAMIIERIQARGAGPFWLFDCYHHLVESGVCRDEALEALTAFTDDIIAAKKRKRLQLVTSGEADG